MENNAFGTAGQSNTDHTVVEVNDMSPIIIKNYNMRAVPLKTEKEKKVKLTCFRLKVPKAIEDGAGRASSFWHCMGDKS